MNYLDIANLPHLLYRYRGVIIVGLVLAVGVHSCTMPYDDTDDAANGKRSGVRLTFDYGTGCIYLRTWSGGITPRLDEEGKPMCQKLYGFKPVEQ